MIDEYLKRICYTGSLEPNYETLCALHAAHVFSVPFENLDVFYGRGISLDPEKIFSKLVTHKRGGYCFEMNALFAQVLTECGFKVESLLASVLGAPREQQARLHQVLFVELGSSRYLADVGFGSDGIAGPLLLEEDIEQTQFVDTYRLMRDDNLRWVLERKTDDGFAPMYAIAPDECVALDFEIANHFTATHPGSFFRSMCFVTKPTPTGRVTLTAQQLKVVENGLVTQQEFAEEAEFAKYLRELFGLNLSEIVSDAV